MIRYILNDSGRKVGIKLILGSMEWARAQVVESPLSAPFVFEVELRYDAGTMMEHSVDRYLSTREIAVSNIVFQKIPKHMFIEDKTETKKLKVKMTKSLYSFIDNSAEIMIARRYCRYMLECYVKKHPKDRKKYAGIEIFLRQKALRVINGMINTIMTEGLTEELRQIRRFNPMIRHSIYQFFVKYGPRMVQLSDSCPYLLYQVDMGLHPYGK